MTKTHSVDAAEPSFRATDSSHEFTFTDATGERRVLEARLRRRFMDPRCKGCGGRGRKTSLNKTQMALEEVCRSCDGTGCAKTPSEALHPRGYRLNLKGDHIRGRDDEIEELNGQEIFGTGEGGGPSIHVGFNDWTIIPNNRGGRHVLAYIRADPVLHAQVELRTRPYADNVVDLLDDPTIKHMDGAEYARAHMSENAPHAESTAPAAQRKRTRAAA